MRPDQTEVYDGLLLALLARKRLLLLVGEAGSGRAAVFAQLLEHVEADGALVLPAVAVEGARVEDLIAAAGNHAIPPKDDEERDFDTLVEQLEERLDLAGYGLLAIEEAQTLSVETLADLAELTWSESPAGRCLQVLLCGTPELERMMAVPALAAALREGGVIYRLAPGAVPTVAPLTGTAAGPSPTVAPHASPGPGPSPLYPLHPTGGRPGNAAFRNDRPGDGRFDDLNDGWPPQEPDWIPPRTSFRPNKALLAGVAVTVLVLVGAGVAATMPNWQLITQPLAMARDGWGGIRTFADQHIGNPFTDTDGAAMDGQPGGDPLRRPVTVPPNRTDGPTAGSHMPEPAKVGSAASPSASAPVASLARTTPPASATSTTTAALPPPSSISVNPSAEPTAEDEADSPETSTDVLPPLEDPPTIANLPSSASPEQAEQSKPMDPATAERVRTLVEEARRQIAARQLTTPANNNAYDTVRRLRALAPNAPEIQELLSSMEQTYRRWAAVAEQRGDWNNARHFYERALIVAPSKDDLRERIETSDEREADAEKTNPPVKPGLESREAAIALLRRPQELREALDKNANINTRIGDGKTLLMLAAEHGLTEAVRILLQRNARTDLRTGDGATAVMYAAWGGHEGVVNALAEAKADLDATTADGKTALMAAAARGHVGVVRNLLNRNVDVDRTTGHGWSALMYAANNGHERIVRMLVDRGANPYRMDNDGNSALTLGALQGHVQVVEILKPR